MTTHAFEPREDGQCILISGGVYRVAELFSRGEHIYARYGAGYIRLYKGGGTSKAKMRWEDITIDVYADAFGRLTIH